MRKIGFSLGLAAALASCGGDGGSSAPPSPPPPPLNSAPEITSAANRNLAENDTEGLEIAAVDRDGDPLTFRISGGADAAAFEFFEDRLLTTGILDFEQPLDADGDNIFEVVIEVSDGQVATRQTLRINLVNDREGFVLRRLRSGLGTVAAASVVDGTLFWVVGTNGSVWQESLDDDRDRSLGRVSGFDGASDAQILAIGSIAAPDGQFNTLILSRHGAEARITEYRPSEIANGTPGAVRWSLAFGSSQTVSVSLFAEGGQMMLALGDNGAPASAQDPGTPFGGLFRIVGAANSGLSFERAGYGLRDPRLGFMTDSRIRVIDRGVLQDEINDWPNGNNFEWPLRDGKGDGPIATVPTMPGTLAPPTFVRPSGTRADESGIFVDYVEGTRYCTLDNLSMIVGTREGRFFSGNPAIGRFEERTQDFVTDEGEIDSVVAVELFDDVYWGRQSRAAVIDRDGEIFLLEQDIPCDKA